MTSCVQPLGPLSRAPAGTGTPTSTDPIVSAVFATESSNFGQGVLYIATNTDLLGIQVAESNVLVHMENEVALNLRPPRLC
jgi:hypothetical protein